MKPQFEAGRQVVARGRGLVRDPEVWAAVLGDVTSAFEQGGAAIMGVMVSPITGADGNVEFLLHACLGGGTGPDAAALVAAAVAEATEREQR